MHSSQATVEETAVLFTIMIVGERQSRTDTSKVRTLILIKRGTFWETGLHLKFKHIKCASFVGGETAVLNCNHSQQNSTGQQL